VRFDPTKDVGIQAGRTGTISSPAVSSRRQQKRFSYKGGTVALYYNAKGPTLSGSLLDVSTRGCLLLMEEPAALNPTQIVGVELAFECLKFCSLGTVRHLKEKNKMVGIEFFRLKDQDRFDLSNFIRYLEVTAVREEQD